MQVIKLLDLLEINAPVGRIMKPDRIVVFYGTNTGTAEEYAERLAQSILKTGYENVTLWNCLERDLAELSSNTLILGIISTAGTGNMPSSFVKSWNTLKKRTMPSLNRLKFALFGLGDGNYGENFCKAGRLLHSRLKQLGAQPIVPLGVGDVQAPEGHDNAFLPWLKMLLNSLELKEDSIICLRPSVLVKEVAKNSVSKNREDDNARVTLCERITHESHFQDVRKVSFRLDPKISFSPGDVAVIKPKNDPEAVRLAKTILSNLVSDYPQNDEAYLALLPNRPDAKIKHETCLALSELLSDVLDLNRPPPQHKLAYLQNFVGNKPDDMYSKKLKELGTDLDLYNLYVWRPKRTILEVLKDFSPVLSFTVSDLFDIFTVIQARHFSIASSPTEPYVSLCVARVQYKTNIVDKERVGLGSRYLCDLKNGTSLSVGIVGGSIALPNLIPPDAHFIFLCSGTGIAPIRSMLIWLRDTHTHILNQCWLIQGCRYIDKDALFHQELSALNLHRYTLKGSRDAKPVQYLQHMILENKKELAEWILHKNAHVTLSGHNRLPSLIREALQGFLPAGHVRDMERHGRFQHETW